MDIQTAITEIRESGLYGNQVHQETLELALTALQEQAERGKGCPLCHSERLKNVAIVNHWGEDQIALVSGKVDENEQFVFCPKCGRYLGDKND